MGGRRTTKQELEQIEILTEEGLTNREIGEKLSRSETAIRNIRFKKNLPARVKNENGKLLQQKTELTKETKTLLSQKASLTNEVNSLMKTKQNIEGAIKTDKILLEQTLTKALVNMKQQRPDLFYMTGTDQIVRLVSVFMNAVR